MNNSNSMLSTLMELAQFSTTNSTMSNELLSSTLGMLQPLMEDLVDRAEEGVDYMADRESEQPTTETYPWLEDHKEDIYFANHQELKVGKIDKESAMSTQGIRLFKTLDGAMADLLNFISGKVDLEDLKTLETLHEYLTRSQELAELMGRVDKANEDYKSSLDALKYAMNNDGKVKSAEDEYYLD